MSASCQLDHCRYCQLHVDECTCDYCEDCFEKLSAVFGARDSFCRDCRAECESCLEPVLHGVKRCDVCEADLQRSNVLAFPRIVEMEAVLRTRGLA